MVKKILRISCSETRPSITVPVLKYSSRTLSLAKTISAPILALLIASQAATVWEITGTISCSGFWEPRNFFSFTPLR